MKQAMKRAMKRAISLGITLLFVITLCTACGNQKNASAGTNQTAYEKVPLLDVRLVSDDSSEQKVQALQLSGSWTVHYKNGTGSTSHWDSAHSLQIKPADHKEMTLHLSSTSSVVEMLFSNDNLPSSISAQRWNAAYVKGDQDISDVMNKGESVEISNGTIRINDDGRSYIYEIYAKWTEGYSYYTFRTESNMGGEHDLRNMTIHDVLAIAENIGADLMMSDLSGILKH